MFIAFQLQCLCAPAERDVALGLSVYIPLLTERDGSGVWGYKHVAPPEQEPDTDDDHFRTKLKLELQTSTAIFQ
jgi:hypothetical protein